MDRDLRGLLVVLSGPSGVGKDTVAARLLERPGRVRVVTATTRPPKAGEKHGLNYLFFTEESFLQKVDEGGFLEYARVFGHLYGTPFDAVRTYVRQGTTALLLIDVQGARQVRKAAIPALFIFIAPPDIQSLRERLRGRGRDDAEELERRLAEAERELAASSEYDHVVVNEDLDRTVEEIEALIDKRRSQSGGKA
jgi:guanylate kinase